MSAKTLNSMVGTLDCENGNVRSVEKRASKNNGMLKDNQILLKVSSTEKQYLQEIARSRGITLSKLIMDSVLHAVV